MGNIIIIGNESGIRIINRDGWPKSLASKIVTGLSCPSQDGLLHKINWLQISNDIRNTICNELIAKIQYQNNKS